MKQNKFIYVIIAILILVSIGYEFFVYTKFLESDAPEWVFWMYLFGGRR